MSKQYFKPKLIHINDSDYNQYAYLDFSHNYNFKNYNNGIVMPLISSIVCRTDKNSPLFQTLNKLNPHSTIISDLAQQEHNVESFDHKVELTIPKSETPGWLVCSENKFKKNIVGLKYVSLGGPKELYRIGQMDNNFFKAFAKGCKDNAYIPKTITLAMGLSDDFITTFMTNFLLDKVHIFTNKKHVTAGYNGNERFECSLSLYKKIMNNIDNIKFPSELIIGNKLESHLILASKNSKFFPILFTEFPHIENALLLVFKNDFTINVVNIHTPMNTFEYIASSMENPNGHMMRLLLFYEYMKEYLCFYDKQSNVNINTPKNIAPWWKNFINTINPANI